MPCQRPPGGPAARPGGGGRPGGLGLPRLVHWHHSAGLVGHEHLGAVLAHHGRAGWSTTVLHAGELPASLISGEQRQKTRTGCVDHWPRLVNPVCCARGERALNHAVEIIGPRPHQGIGQVARPKTQTSRRIKSGIARQITGGSQSAGGNPAAAAQYVAKGSKQIRKRRATGCLANFGDFVPRQSRLLRR